MKRNTLNNVLNKARVKTALGLKLIALCCILFGFGCKSRKPLVVKRVADTTAAVKPVDTRAAKLELIKSKQTSFNTFTGKAKTKLDINGNTNDVTLNIRIQRDKKIWVSITAIAGIEVARAMITPDSLLLINKLQSLYLRKPFSYVNKYAGEQVNYRTLESLLIGNAIPELLTENAEFKTDSGNTTISGNLSEVLYKLMLGPDMKATQTNLSNQNARQTLQVTNSAFIQATNKIMPSQIDIASVVKDKKIQVNLHYTKADYDLPVEFPFSIPSRYQPAD
ncbi:DUF4292 domain-containing protein [Mucilaginibacter sp.]|uniref:DUF4292 domain-containing protein n=1 Tax=Mucilaginibacter sp. TaxID=1882438 RepID=UPI0025EA963A|nr:DUF4292 domain-containing protein [Mucilaginibacter sp.]